MGDFESREMIARAASVGAIWVVSKLLEQPKARKMLDRIDDRIDDIQHSAVVRTRKKAKQAGHNAKHNLGYVAVGVTAFAIAAALITRATIKD